MVAGHRPQVGQRDHFSSLLRRSSIDGACEANLRIEPNMLMNPTKGPGFTQTAIPRNRGNRKITATSFDNYTKLSNDLFKNVNQNKAMIIGQ